MSRPIRRAAVIGAGVMGSGIAAHLANAGVEVLLMDIVPPGLSEAEKRSRAARDRFAAGGLEKAIKARPAAFFHKDRARLVSVGNVEDDLEQAARTATSSSRPSSSRSSPSGRSSRSSTRSCPTHCIVASNTSGLRIAEMTQGPVRGLPASASS